MREREVWLVSACLLGMPVAYDGQGRLVAPLLEWAAQGRLIPICPEVAGGLPIPRPTAEIVGGSGEDVLDGEARVMTQDGREVTRAYLRGAALALEAARRFGAAGAVLKARSPSCGASQIYDGTHSRRLVPGRGVTAALLDRAGLKIATGSEWAGG